MKLVNYEQALLLKKLGFNESCYERFYNGEAEIDYGNWNSYDNEKIVSRPTYSQVYDWFRTNYNIFSNIDIGTHDYTVKISLMSFKSKFKNDDVEFNDDYDKKQTMLFNNLLKMIPNKKK